MIDIVQAGLPAPDVWDLPSLSDMMSQPWQSTGRSLLQAAANATAPARAPAPAPGKAPRSTAIGAQGIVVLVTLGIGMVIMVFDWIGPDFVFAFLGALYMTCRFITIPEGVAGFSNTGILTVVALYVAAEGITQTGGLEKLFGHVLGRNSSYYWAIVRMFIPAFVAGGFLNNTPVVAMLIPILIAWGNRRNVSPKKLLIPLAYSQSLGGALTLISTSTNLIVSGFQEARYRIRDPANATFGFFEITPYGIVLGMLAFMYVTATARFLLPGGAISKGEKNMFLALRVRGSSKVQNRTVREAGLKGLTDLFLVSVGRQGRMYHAVSPDFVLLAGDDLYFRGTVGAAENVAYKHDLQFLTAESSAKQGGTALTPLEDGETDTETGEHSALPARTVLLQATIRRGSDVAGQTIAQADLKGRFGFQVIAVKRGSDALGGLIADHVLHTGDTLVVTADQDIVVKDSKYRKTFKGLSVVDAQLEKEYLTGMRVAPRCGLVGKSLLRNGLMGVNGINVVAIDRVNGEHIRDIDADTVVEASDVLWFNGSLEGVAYLMRVPGLTSTQNDQLDKLGVSILERRLVQVVVSQDRSLSGKTVREAGFRARYDAVVIGVNREGQAITEDVRDVRLHPGDVLVLDTGAQFAERHRDSRAFTLITEVPNTSPLKARKMWWALFLMAALIGLQLYTGISEIETLPLLPGAILVAAIMLLTGCMSGEQARKSIYWDVFVCIAFSFAISRAMEKTNVALQIARLFENLSRDIGGEIAPLTAMYVATAILTEVVSNNAAAAVMYPIAATMGDALGIKPGLISISIMLGASASFITPVGYQVNLMVYAAGGYNTMDFIKIGSLLHLVQLAGVILVFALWEQIWMLAGLAIGVTAVFIAILFVLTRDAVRHRLTPKRFRKKALEALPSHMSLQSLPGKEDAAGKDDVVAKLPVGDDESRSSNDQAQA